MTAARIGPPVDDPRVSVALDRLARSLAELAACDPSMRVETGEITPEDADGMADLYARRNRAVLVALGAAVDAGLSAGIGFDPASGPEWPVVYVDLPRAGQVSWHLTAYPMPWDGHTTPEKYARVADWLADPEPRPVPVPEPCGHGCPYGCDDPVPDPADVQARAEAAGFDPSGGYALYLAHRFGSVPTLAEARTRPGRRPLDALGGPEAVAGQPVETVESDRP
jgi:hypothetical protein